MGSGRWFGNFGAKLCPATGNPRFSTNWHNACVRAFNSAFKMKNSTDCRSMARRVSPPDLLGMHLAGGEGLVTIAQRFNVGSSRPRANSPEATADAAHS